MLIDFLDELRWRGLLHQCTDEAGLRVHLADPARNPRRGYAGFDPTADSLTIGNLVPIMALVHFQRAGHEPVVVMGGGTGLVGDPSGKSAERLLATEETVRANVEAQRPIFERVFAYAAEADGRAVKQPPILNNLDWLGKLGFLEVLRDVGKHFSVNMMIQKDSVRERLHAREQGISYTEFSYMILQACDYLRLWLDYSVSVQMGGSDQWGNIVAGRDLIKSHAALHGAHRHGLDPAMTFGLTAPLITKADGGKFGKSETGAVWLTPDRTTPYQFFQYWLNTSDTDVGKFLRLFTLLPRDRVEAIEREHVADPSKRTAQRELARNATALVHGRTEAEAAEAAGKALFGGGGGGGRAEFERLIDAMSEAPSAPLDRARLEGEGLPILDAVALPPLAASKREAREHLSTGAVSVNGERVGIDYRLTTRDLLKGNVIALRRGKKTWLLLRVGS